MKFDRHRNSNPIPFIALEDEDDDDDILSLTEMSGSGEGAHNEVRYRHSNHSEDHIQIGPFNNHNPRVVFEDRLADTFDSNVNQRAVTNNGDSNSADMVVFEI